MRLVPNASGQTLKVPNAPAPERAPVSAPAVPLSVVPNMLLVAHVDCRRRACCSGDGTVRPSRSSAFISTGSAHEAVAKSATTNSSRQRCLIRGLWVRGGPTRNLRGVRLGRTPIMSAYWGPHHDYDSDSDPS